MEIFFVYYDVLINENIISTHFNKAFLWRRQSQYVKKEKWKDFPTLSSLYTSLAGIMDRGINGICSQFWPAAPHEFRQFCGAWRGKAYFWRGGAAFFFAGRSEHPWYVTSVHTVSQFHEFQGVFEIFRKDLVQFHQLPELRSFGSYFSYKVGHLTQCVYGLHSFINDDCLLKFSHTYLLQLSRFIQFHSFISFEVYLKFFRKDLVQFY